MNTDEELETCRKYMPTTESRIDCKDSFVIGRYSVLPYYKELEYDLASMGSKLINNYQQHKWIANFDYYDVLKNDTFETWDDSNFYQCTYNGPFVVKGRTNSRKHNWNELMFAENKRHAAEISSRLFKDPLIAEQGVIYRKYEPLEVFEVGANNLPFANEWRFFFWGYKMLSYGYYWSIAERADQYTTIEDEGQRFACSIALKCYRYVNFFVVDIAKTAKGKWKLVELNDAQMSGLSMNNPDRLYDNIAQHFNCNLK